MKKLSFIMAVLMILMCLPVMAMTSASAANSTATTAPVASLDIKKTNDAAYVFVGAYATGFADDEAALADTSADYYWRIGEEGTDAYYFQYMQDAAAVALKKGNSNVVYMVQGYKATSQLGNDIGRAQSMKIEQDLIIDGQGKTLECAVAGVWTYRFESTESDLKMNYAFVIQNMNINLTLANSFFQVRGHVVFDNVNFTSSTTTAFGAFLMQSPIVADLRNSEFKTVASSGGNTNGAMFRFNEANASRKSEVNIYNTNVTLANSFVMYNANGGSATNKLTINIYSGSMTTTDPARDMFALVKKNVCLNVYGGTLVSQGMFVNANSSGEGFELNIHGGNIMAGKGKDAIQGGVKNSVVNISGGTITMDGGRLISLVNPDLNQTLNITGGNFIGKNYVYDIYSFSDTPNPNGSMIRMTANTENVKISGGNFTIYSDNGATLADKGAIIYGWGSGADLVKVYGGTFTGGEAYLVRGVYTNDKTNPLDVAKSKIYAYADGSNTTTIGTVVEQGAAIRLNKTPGLRFTSTMDATAINFIKTELMKEGTEITYGTVITASDYLKFANGVFTKEALAAAGMSYIDVVAKDGLVKNADGSVTINASLVNIKEENYDRDFVAISYMTYTNKDDEVVTVYATNVNLAKYSRNAEEVAFAALADVQKTAVGPYATEVSEYYEYNSLTRKYELVTGKAYSRYTADQLAIVKTYIK